MLCTARALNQANAGGKHLEYVLEVQCILVFGINCLNELTQSYFISGESCSLQTICMTVPRALIQTICHLSQLQGPGGPRQFFTIARFSRYILG